MSAGHPHQAPHPLQNPSGIRMWTERFKVSTKNRLFSGIFPSFTGFPFFISSGLVHSLTLTLKDGSFADALFLYSPFQSEQGPLQRHRIFRE